MKFSIKSIITIIIFALTLFVLVLSVRGLAGNPKPVELNTPTWKENGPFELSPERGRFSLLYSMAEDHSMVFSKDIGKFAEPDVAVSNGKYVSLFAPLVSFLTVPGYLIGKYFGVAQVGTFFIISIFAFINVVLIRQIGILLGADKWPSTIAGLIFLFATPAFAYAVNLYQHHISSFLILLGIYALLRFKNVWGLMIVFFVCAAAIPLDYPNLFFMFPLGLYAFIQIFSLNKIRNKVSFKINFVKFLALFIMIIPIIFFLWFNYASYSNPFQLAGTLQSVKDIQGRKNDVASEQARKELEQQKKHKTAIALFNTRNMLNGFYLHSVSPDRGIIYYSPVILFGFIGMYLAFRKKVQLVGVLTAIIGANILLYEMWGDPWGGWAFGSRYLIPSYAVLSIFIALLLTYWRKKVWFLAIFLVLAVYSVAVNTLGAITTSALPPQVEILALEKITHTVQRYTYQKNWEFLLSGQSKSFIYQQYLRDLVSAVQYYFIITTVICSMMVGIMGYYVFQLRKGDKHV